jgi:hypothetical protein
MLHTHLQRREHATTELASGWGRRQTLVATFEAWRRSLEFAVATRERRAQLSAVLLDATARCRKANKNAALASSTFSHGVLRSPLRDTTARCQPGTCQDSGTPGLCTAHHCCHQQAGWLPSVHPQQPERCSKGVACAHQLALSDAQRAQFQRYSTAVQRSAQSPLILAARQASDKAVAAHRSAAQQRRHLRFAAGAECVLRAAQVTTLAPESCKVEYIVLTSNAKRCVVLNPFGCKH